MNYPTEITIRGATYSILYHDKMREVDDDLENTSLLGQAAHFRRVLHIYRQQPPLDLLDTIVHEIIHTIFSRNKALRLALKEDTEEYFVDALAIEIALILMDNGWFKPPKQRPPLTTRIVDCKETKE